MKTIIISLMVFLLIGCSDCQKFNEKPIKKPKPIPTFVVYYISGGIDTIQVPNKTCGIAENASNIILNDKSCLGYYCCKMTQSDAYFNSIACDVKKYELLKNEF
jgi:hypothetical protein